MDEFQLILGGFGPLYRSYGKPLIILGLATIHLFYLFNYLPYP